MWLNNVVMTLNLLLINVYSMMLRHEGTTWRILREQNNSGVICLKCRNENN